MCIHTVLTVYDKQCPYTNFLAFHKSSYFSLYITLNNGLGGWAVPVKLHLKQQQKSAQPNLHQVPTPLFRRVPAMCEKNFLLLSFLSQRKIPLISANFFSNSQIIFISGIASLTIWSYYVNFKSSLFISLEIVVVTVNEHENIFIQD